MTAQSFTRKDTQILRMITQQVSPAPSVLYRESEVARLRQTGDRLKAAEIKKTSSMFEKLLGLFEYIFKRKHKLLATRAEEIRARVRWQRSDLNSRLS